MRQSICILLFLCSVQAPYPQLLPSTPATYEEHSKFPQKTHHSNESIEPIPVSTIIENASRVFPDILEKIQPPSLGPRLRSLPNPFPKVPSRNLSLIHSNIHYHQLVPYTMCVDYYCTYSCGHAWYSGRTICWISGPHGITRTDYTAAGPCFQCRQIRPRL